MVNLKSFQLEYLDFLQPTLQISFLKQGHSYKSTKGDN